MTLAEIRTALKRYGFDDSDPLDTWINSALDELESMFLWPFLYRRDTLTLAADESTLTLPSDFQKVISLRIGSTNGSKLSYMNPRQLDREMYRYIASGSPAVYSVVGTEIDVYPTPDEDTDLVLTYVGQISTLVNSSDVPNIPDNLHYTVVRGAAYIALQAENEEERAQTAFAEFERDASIKWNRLATPTEDEPDQVVDVMGYGGS